MKTVYDAVHAGKNVTMFQSYCNSVMECIITSEGVDEHRLLLHQRLYSVRLNDAFQDLERMPVRATCQPCFQKMLKRKQSSRPRFLWVQRFLKKTF